MIVAGIAFGATPLQFSSTSSQPRTLPPAQLNSRRKALFSGAIGSIALIARPALSLGLESIDLPPPEMPAGIADQIANIQRRNKQTLNNAEDRFQSSSLLKTLMERSEAGRDVRQKELRDRYCMRQAELGIGDCAGLRLIPGATKSGVQKRPEWLDKLLGGIVEE